MVKGKELNDTQQRLISVMYIVKGLDWVKIDKKKPVAPTNDVLNDMEKP